MRTISILSLSVLLLGTAIRHTAGAEEIVANIGDGTITPAGASSKPSQALPAAPAVQPCASGVAVGPGCWFLGQLNESCETVCANAPGGPLPYNHVTNTFAGSDGADAHCEAVLDALGVPPGGVVAAICTGGAPTSGVGCIVFPAPPRIRCVDPPTDPIGAGTNVARACACGLNRAAPAPALSPLALVVLAAVIVGAGARRLRRV